MGRIYVNRRPAAVRQGLGIFADLDGDSQQFLRNDVDFPESGVTGDMTIQVWVKFDVVTGTIYLVTKTLAGGNQRSYTARRSLDRISVQISVDGITFTTKNSANVGFATDVWYHLAWVYDASAGEVEVFVDGISFETLTGLPNAIFDSTATFRIGSHVDVPSYFGGGIYEARLYNDIRTPAEILASAQDPNEDASGHPNIIGQWRWDGASDDTFIDNTQGDAGRDLIPYDGGNVTYGNCGRTVGDIGTVG